MKKYTWTIELEVSEQNESLIPLLASKNGFILDGETPDESVLRIVKERTGYTLKEDMIISRLNNYFGEQGEPIVASIKESLDNGALTISSKVENIV